MSFIKTIIRRVIISAVREGKIKRFDADGLQKGEFTDREFFQQYGLTSFPKAGAEGIVIGIGNVFYMIASDDRSCRVPLSDEGDVAMYSDINNYILQKASGNTLIKSAAKVTIDSPAIALADGTYKLADERIVTAINALTFGGHPIDSPLVLANVATAKTKAS
jgi:phage gp45-like